MKPRSLKETNDRLSMLHSVMEDVMEAYDSYLLNDGSTSNAEASLGSQLGQLLTEISTVRRRAANLGRGTDE